MKFSYVIYFHSSRLDNLQQMIRLLTKRESVSQAELVLVCQDRCDWTPVGFGEVQTLALGLPGYCKPIMCNQGVKAATGQVIALLDSDRILPPMWFGNAAERIQKGQALCPRNLLKCLHPYNDEVIESGSMEVFQEIRCSQNSYLQKNAFSGCTVLHRSDYLDVGGMDETFIGYGFADNDMVETCLSKGITFLYDEVPEIHLYHEPFVVVGEQRLPRSQFRVQTLLNGLRFCRKWKRPLTEPLLGLLDAVLWQSDVPQAEEINLMMDSFRLLL